jgi:hypothetical protein
MRLELSKPDIAARTSAPDPAAMDQPSHDSPFPADLPGLRFG